MTVGEYCNREVIVVSGGATIQEAAQLMRQYHVGDLILVEERNGRNLPTGIVTDRDLVVEVMAPGLSPHELAVRDLVTQSLYLAHEDDSLIDALEVMRSRGVRRIPVVDNDRALVGLITEDDVVGLLAEMLDALAAVVERERQQEERRRP